VNQIIQQLEKMKKTHTRLGQEYYMLCQENITIDKCIRVVKRHMRKQGVLIDNAKHSL